MSEKLCGHLKNFSYPTKSKETLKIVLNIRDELCRDSVKIPNLTNEHFPSIANKLASYLKVSEGTYCLGGDSVSNSYGQKGIAKVSYVLQPVTQDFIMTELQRLSPKKSDGLVGWHTFHISERKCTNP